MPAYLLLFAPLILYDCEDHRLCIIWMQLQDLNVLTSLTNYELNLQIPFKIVFYQYFTISERQFSGEFIYSEDL